MNAKITASIGGGTSQTNTKSPQPSNTSAPSSYVIAEDGLADDDVSYEEQFKPYEQFGLTYDASKNGLQYNGKVVRWFEDYYTVGDDIQAGKDFFNENGVVDVYAVRDLSGFVRSEDGSFDPSGKLIGIEKFSQAEFDEHTQSSKEVHTSSGECVVTQE